MISLVLYNFTCHQDCTLFKNLESNNEPERSQFDELAVGGFWYWCHGKFLTDFIVDQHQAGISADGFTEIFSTNRIIYVVIFYLIADGSGRSIESLDRLASRRANLVCDSVVGVRWRVFVLVDGWWACPSMHHPCYEMITVHSYFDSYRSWYPHFFRVRSS